MTDVNTTEDFADDYDDAITEATAVIDNGSFGTRTIRFETGRLALQAAGSVTAYLDDENMLLSTTAASKHPKEHFDFFPLTVDVEERMYAAGRIPGSFFRREGRPSTDAILTCRLIDRPLRPSFVDGLRNEIQVVVTVLSLNPNDLYDVVKARVGNLDLPPGAVHTPEIACQPAGEPDTWVRVDVAEYLEHIGFDRMPERLEHGVDGPVVKQVEQRSDSSFLRKEHRVGYNHPPVVGPQDRMPQQGL